MLFLDIRFWKIGPLSKIAKKNKEINFQFTIFWFENLGCSITAQQTFFNMGYIPRRNFYWCCYIWRRARVILQNFVEKKLLLMKYMFKIYNLSLRIQLVLNMLNLPSIRMFGCKVVVTKVEWEPLDLATPPTAPVV